MSGNSRGWIADAGSRRDMVPYVSVQPDHFFPCFVTRIVDYLRDVRRRTADGDLLFHQSDYLCDVRFALLLLGVVGAVGEHDGHQSGEDADDGDDDQHFHQSEAAGAAAVIPAGMCAVAGCAVHTTPVYRVSAGFGGRRVENADGSSMWGGIRRRGVLHRQVAVSPYRIYNVWYMENDETNGLRSIERSKLSSAKQSSARRKPVAKRRRPSGVRENGNGRKKHGVRKIIISGAVVLVLGIVLLHTMFASATLTLTLASADVRIDGSFSAIREPAQSPDGISYSKIGPFSETKTATITNITRERQNTYAEGTIVVYNTNTGGENLNLVNRTRFLTDDNKLYRLNGRQVIPGGKSVNGEFVPGRKEVKVIADKIGDGYNIPKSGVRFSIPGLAKYKQFSTSYAVSSTSIVGGFSGERFIPDPDEAEAKRKQLRKEIRSVLENELVEALDTNTLAKRVVFDTGRFITYESLPNEQSGNGVIIREQGELYAISFRERELAAFIVRFGSSSSSVIPSGTTPGTVNVTNVGMTLETDEEFDIISSTEFDFTLKGDAEVFWDIDTPLFLSDIEGQKKITAEDIMLERYPQITKQAISIFPPWRSSLPGNREKITLEIGHRKE